MEIRPHKAHAAIGIGVVDLWEDMVLGYDRCTGCILASRFAAHITHRGGMPKEPVVCGDALDLGKCLVRWEKIIGNKKT